MSVETDLRRLRAEAGELLARHERAVDVRAFGRYADDPEGFIREILRGAPWSLQVEMAERVRDHGRTVVVTANGLGKDWLVARLALWWAYAVGGFAILTGPTERQVKQIAMREMRRAFAAAPELPGELYSLELRIGGSDAGVLAFTSDNADKLTGFHHPRLAIFIMEGQAVEEHAYEAAYACLTAPQNRLLVYGNPTKPAGPFYQAATGDGWSVLTIRADQHPNVLTGRPEIPGAVSRDWIEMMREEYGEASPIFRARVLAEFPEQSIEGLLKRSWVEAAVARWHSGELEAIAREALPFLVLDIARYGPDSSVLGTVQGPIVRSLEAWRGASVVESVDRTVDRAERHWRETELERGRPMQQPRIVVDEPGLGGGAIDLLRKRDWPVVAYNGAAKAQNPRRFLNVRAESHWAIRAVFENAKAAIPPDDLLIEEALALEWQLTTAGQIQVVGKDSVRGAIGRSPDRFDTVVMGLSRSVGGLRRVARTVEWM